MAGLETDRLILRRPVLADVPALFTFLGDAATMQHMQVDVSLRGCRGRVVAHEHRRRKDGYAPWTIISKAKGRIMGWGGLYNDPFDLSWGVEIGYFFHPDVWGQGYASEFVTACTEFADHVLKLPVISAFARPENAGSRRLLQ